VNLVNLLVPQTKLETFHAYNMATFANPVINSKKCWVVSTQIWVKYVETQMLGWKCY